MSGVLLLQLDGKLPNLALMRLSAHFKALGENVVLRKVGNEGALGAIEPQLGDGTFDRVFASMIFERTRPIAGYIARVWPRVIIGGTGWNLTTTLDDVGVATEGPLDYSIYPRFTRSIGFTQRGCRLACDFCVVPRKEGRIREVAAIGDVWRGEPWPRDLLLMDNDFFGQPSWRERIAEIRAGDFRVCWNQGINARMLNDEVAAAIASVRYYDDQFQRPRIYTAWDGRKDERMLFRGLEALKRHGVLPNRVMVYMLIGHSPGETHEDRDYRRTKLREFGCRPYPMPITRAGELGMELVAFQRWVIQRKDEFVPWSQWWGRAHGDPRKLGSRRVSLPLFGDWT